MHICIIRLYFGHCTFKALLMSKTYLTNMFSLLPTDIPLINTSLIVSKPSATSTISAFSSKSFVTKIIKIKS